MRISRKSINFKYAMDILKDILESISGRAKSEGYHNIQTVWTDIEKFEATPIPAGTLDVGFFVNSLYMIKDRIGALKEASRLLRDGGFLVVVDWTKKLGPLGPAPDEMLDQKLFISEETVRTHAKSILAKMGQPNRTQVVVEAVRQGLINLD